MAIDAPESAYMQAFGTIRESFSPLEVAVESIGLVEFLPVRLLHECPLRR